MKLKRVSAITVVFTVIFLLLGTTYSKSSEENPTQSGETAEIIDWADQGSLVQLWMQSLGIAVAPIVGMAAASTFGYYQLSEVQRNNTWFFYKPYFWIPLWVIAALLYFKDFILTFLGPLKTPLDAVGILVRDLGAIFGLGFALTLFLGQNPSVSGLQILLAEIAQWGIMLPFFFCVFITFSAIDVLIFLNPVPFVDSVLSGLRTSILCLFFVGAFIHPTIGLFLVSPVLIFSIWMASKAYRFSIFGLTLASDLLFRKKHLVGTNDQAVVAFATKSFPMAKTNQRGTLTYDHDNNLLKFKFKRFIFGPIKTIELKASNTDPFKIGKATLAPTIIGKTDGNFEQTIIFRLPPRYKSHEDTIGKILNIPEVVDISISKGFKNLFRGVHITYP